MARAKRTDRSEVRRRYRAALLEQGQGDPETDEIETGRADARASRPALRKSEVAGSVAEPRPGARPGLFGSFRAATRPVHYLDDLRYAPTLILRTKAIWPGALLSVAGFVYALTVTDARDAGFGFVIGFVLAPLPLLQPMLAGFFAPRATWLAGIIASVISVSLYGVLLLRIQAGYISNLPADLHLSVGLNTVFSLALYSITFGALLGAASGWYKRFLSTTYATSPRNQKRPAPKRPAPGRQAPRRGR